MMHGANRRYDRRQGQAEAGRSTVTPVRGRSLCAPHREHGGLCIEGRAGLSRAGISDTLSAVCLHRRLQGGLERHCERRQPAGLAGYPS